MKRKILSTILAMTMLISLLPTVAFAAEPTEEPVAMTELTEAEPTAEPAATGNVAKIVETNAEYQTLVAAVEAAASGQTIKLLSNTSGAGIGIFKNTGNKPEKGVKSFTIDFDGYTYTCVGPAVGSSGTESQAFHLEWTGDSNTNANVTLKNGTITATPTAESGVTMIVQNYCNLTIENMVLDGSNLRAEDYTLSNNCGNVVINNSTIIEPTAGGFAFDSCDYSNYTGVTVTVNGNSNIQGHIELTNPNGGDNNASIVINSGTFTDITALKYLASGANVTVKMDENQTADVVIPANATVTLDLNGRTLTGLVTVRGNLTLNDSTASDPVVNSDYSVTYSGGKITRTVNPAVAVENGGQLIMNGGMVESTNGNGINVAGEEHTANWSTAVNSVATINGGYIVAREYGIGVFGNGATLNFTNGVVVAYDNAAIAGNGTKDTSKNDGGTTINISSGTAIGHIVSSGYIACGVYHPQQGALNITGGTIYADGGVGVLARAGKTNITGGEIVATGNVTGGVGDKGVKIPCASVFFDVNPGAYPGLETDDTITISGDAKLSADGAVLGHLTGAEDAKRISVSGGYFTSAPKAEYLSAGHYVVETNELPGYTHKVTDQKPAEPEIIVNEGVTPIVDENIGADKDTVQTAVTTNPPAVTGVADALENHDDILTEAGVTDDEKQDAGNIEVAITVTVTAKSATLTGEGAKHLSFDVTPTATVTVDGTAKAPVAVKNSYLNGEPVTVKLPIPEGFNPLEIMHISSGRRERLLPGDTVGPKTFKIDDGYAILKITHFSEVRMNGTVTVAATIGSDDYGTLQAAIDAAANGATITLQPGMALDETVTIRGKSVNIVKNNVSYPVANITADDGRTTVTDGDTIVVNYTPPVTVTTYPITVADAEHGAVTASRKSASKGTAVTLTVKADEGYALADLTVTDKNGNEIELTEKNGKYTFKMPASKVTVTAVFAPVVIDNPFDDVFKSDYYYDEVLYAYHNGLMVGYEDSFAPGGAFDRKQLAMLLWNMEGNPVVDYAMSFNDVPGDQWYTEAVRWAAATGVMTGYSADTFAPDDLLTRQQMATAFFRYAEAKAEKGDLSVWTDGAAVADWAADGMIWAVNHGLFQGYNNCLTPDATATRAQVAIILYRYCEELA